LQKGWEPRVGDVVIFNSLAGPERKLIIDLDDKNLEKTDVANLCLYSKIANGSSTGWYDKDTVVFTGERDVQKDRFYS
jgi:hypothetical protein